MSSEERYTGLLNLLVTDHAILKYHRLKGSGKNVYLIDHKFTAKLMVSKEQEETKEFEVNFKYVLPINGKELAIIKKISVFILILEKDDRREYVCLPRAFLEQEFFKKKYIDGQERFWQFQISLKDGSTFLRSKGKSKKNVYDISKYINQIKVNYSRKINVIKSL